VVTLVLIELPFAVIRTAFLIITFIYPVNCDHMNISIFFTLRNYLSIIILINRCYILFHNPDDVTGSRTCILKSYTSLDPNQAIFNNNRIQNNNNNNNNNNRNTKRTRVMTQDSNRSESMTTTESIRTNSMDSCTNSSQRMTFDWSSSRSSSYDSKYTDFTKFPARNYLRNLVSNKLYRMKIDDQTMQSANCNQLAVPTDPSVLDESIGTEYSSC